MSIAARWCPWATARSGRRFAAPSRPLTTEKNNSSQCVDRPAGARPEKLPNLRATCGGNLRFIHSGAKSQPVGFVASEESGMTLQSLSQKGTAAFVVMSLLCSSTAHASPTRIDPLVALSVFGTAESRAAVCAAGAAAAAAGAAVASQAGAGPGCVLPAVDAPPPPAVTEAVPPPVAAAPVASSGIGVLPLLLGLAAIAAFAALVLNDDDDDGEVNLPISP